MDLDFSYIQDYLAQRAKELERQKHIDTILGKAINPNQGSVGSYIQADPNSNIGLYAKPAYSKQDNMFERKNYTTYEPKPSDIVDYMKETQREAPDIQEQFYSLLGNHQFLRDPNQTQIPKWDPHMFGEKGMRDIIYNGSFMSPKVDPYNSRLGAGDYFNYPHAQMNETPSLLQMIKMMMGNKLKGLLE